MLITSHTITNACCQLMFNVHYTARIVAIIKWCKSAWNIIAGLETTACISAPHVCPKPPWHWVQYVYTYLIYISEKLLKLHGILQLLCPFVWQFLKVGIPERVVIHDNNEPHSNRNTATERNLTYYVCFNVEIYTCLWQYTRWLLIIMLALNKQHFKYMRVHII